MSCRRARASAMTCSPSAPPVPRCTGPGRTTTAFGDFWRWPSALLRGGRRCLVREARYPVNRWSPPAADFVEVLQQIRGIGVDAVRARSLEFLLPIAAGQQPDAERTCTLRRQHVPDAVAHD